MGFCWHCKYFSFIDYNIDENGNEQGFGTCMNKKSEDYNEEVPDHYGCNKHKSKDKK